MNARTLRDALGSFATGITVVTALDDKGEKVGMTVNSFSSVSLDPPLILWSIAKDALSLDVFVKAEHFAVHVLAEHQQELSERFASRGEDKFAGLNCSNGIENIPLLPDYDACFQCSMEHIYEGGDHFILVGRVLELTQRDYNPLLFYRGNYCKVSDS